MLTLPRRTFLPWNRPLLPQAVAHLAGGWDGRGPLDLSRVLVIVPTRQSGRRLREALAHHASEKQSAVFPPRVVTPEALVNSDGAPGVASRLQSLLAWSEVLRDADLSEFREVFPIDPPARNLAWALQVAEQLLRVQGTLAENGLVMADVATKLPAEFPEAGRWAQLATLEQRQRARLDAAGLHAACGRDPDGSSRQELSGVDRIVLLATVDPLPSVIQWVADHAENRSVEVIVFAPEEEAGHFDAWGRPVVTTWTGRVLQTPRFEDRVHVCLDPRDEAARIAALARQYRTAADGAASGGAVPAPDAVLAIGCADAAIVSALEAEAGRMGVSVFNPEGRPRSEGALYHLLLRLADFARSPTSEAVAGLARCPDFLAFLARRCGGRFSAAALLAHLDELRARHLPADLDAMRAHTRDEAAPALAILADVHAALRDAPFPQNIAGVLADIFAGRLLDEAETSDDQLRDGATEWTAVSRECAEAAREFRRLKPLEWWDVAMRVFGQSRRAADKPAGALELQGWLELLYADEPHIVVAGLNDGLVPETVTEDAFLPESLRTRLGLRTNAARFARDAYLLQALIASRPHGRVDLLLARASAEGDPLRPSRLLLRCPDHELPQRVALLFRQPATAESHRPWARAWRLRPPVLPPPPKVAVTALRRWLACPFRFYLKHVLRMDAVDTAKGEMDAFDFGTLCHAALEAMAREAALRDCTDAREIREFLVGQLEQRARAKFGGELSLPLVIQLESARQRLSRFAEIQAAERVAGWVIEAVERPFAIELEGLLVSGKIDRIDRNVQTGAVRVLDYKTSDRGVAPDEAHLRALRRGESLPDWATVRVGEKLRAWADLQLPLYRHALAAECGHAIAAGYVILPKAVGQTAVSLWEGYSPELQEAGMRCARGVCAAIREGRYWPPNEAIPADADEFSALFHNGVAESVAWTPAEIVRSDTIIAADAGEKAAP